MANRVVRFIVGGVAAVAVGLVGVEIAGGGRSPHRGTLAAAPTRVPAVADGSAPGRTLATTTVTTVVATAVPGPGDEAVRPREIDPASVPTKPTTPEPGGVPPARRRAAASVDGERSRCGPGAIQPGSEAAGTWVLTNSGRWSEIKYRNTSARLIEARGGVIEFTMPDGPPERREVHAYRPDLCPGDELAWSIVLDRPPVGAPRLVEEHGGEPPR